MWTRTKLLSALLALANLVRGGKESNSTIHSSIFQPSRLLGPIVLSTHHWAALLVASTLSLPRSPLPATFRCDPFETAINFSSFSFVLSPVNFTRYVFDFLRRCFAHAQPQSVSITLPSGCSGSGACTSSNFYDPVVGSDDSPAISSSSSLVASLTLVVAALLALV